MICDNATNCAQESMSVYLSIQDVFPVVLPDMMCDNATNCTQECLFNVTTNMDVCSCFRGYTLNTDNFTCDG